MPLLADYAITPDVFDVASYSTPGECEARLDNIRQVMLTEGVVRDLRDGEWHGIFEPDTRQWHRRSAELVKKLATQGRLVSYPPALPDPPLDDRDWCTEALASRNTRPFTGGVIVTESVKDCYPERGGGRPHRPAAERNVVGCEKLVSPADADSCRLRDASRSDPALLEFGHVHRCASGSRQAEVRRIRHAPAARRTEDARPTNRDPPCLL